MIALSESWKAQVPASGVGLLWLGQVPNLSDSPALVESRKELEAELRARYKEMDRKSIRSLPVFAAYDSFYRTFKKTYHVQLQLESIVFKGKSIFSPSALVACMFMAELKTGLLTAGHDAAALAPPLAACVAQGGEHYQRLNGSFQELKEGDLYIRDQQGILSSVIYGPDQRTQITESTQSVIFTTYGPPGIKPSWIRDQLEILEGYARLFAPNLIREELIVL